MGRKRIKKLRGGETIKGGNNSIIVHNLQLLARVDYTHEEIKVLFPSDLPVLKKCLFSSHFTDIIGSG